MAEIKGQIGYSNHRRILFACLLWSSLPASAVDYAKDLPIIPGDFAHVGTHRLHYRCLGNGTPTIVIENGIAGSATEWYEVQRILAPDFRTCVYDRAGYGWSDPGPAPRTTEQITAELQALLVNSGESPPYVLIGHSFGGFTAIYFASTAKRHVAGIVLVDSSSPNIGFAKSGQNKTTILNPVANSGTSISDYIPRTAKEMARFLNSRRRALFTQMDEIANFERSAEQVRHAEDIASIPLLIVARDPIIAKDEASREEHWRGAQQALKGLSNKSEIQFAVGSDHFVHLNKPQWLGEAIIKFVKSLR